MLRADNSAPIRIIRDRMLFLFGLGLPALDELSGHQKVPSSERIELNRHTRLTERSVALLAPRPAQVPKFGCRILAPTNMVRSTKVLPLPVLYDTHAVSVNPKVSCYLGQSMTN